MSGGKLHNLIILKQNKIIAKRLFSLLEYILWYNVKDRQIVICEVIK